ncbi:MAG: UvrD-helicase domain-containing protein, partial [Aquificaceae bacterium]|nr:UvrD-helicase domain-containing protein [Aquificaceae bacterium]
GKPLLVVAGAGSGKTKTLAHKVEFLIKEKGIRPDRILALTFTNKAGKEIRERVKGVVGMDLPWSGTFHSVALRLLRERGREVGISHDFSILSEGDRDQLIRKIAQSMGLKEELLKAYISKRIEDMQEAEESELEKAFQQYLRLIREMNLLDFGCLMLYLHKLLRLSPSIRESFDFILVD